MTSRSGQGAYPTFAALLERDGDLAGTSWGVFPEPERGTPSFIGPDAVLDARSCIRTGEVFGLDYPADAFDPGMSLKRSAPRHIIYSSHPAHRDDYLDGYYLQGSTQIDGLRHRRADDVGFYNGTPDDRIREGTPDLGIQEWSDHPIAGRGVLVDLDGYRTGQDSPIDHAGGEPLSLDLIKAAIEAQSVRLRSGDILMLHTGWCEWFLALSPEEKQQTRGSRQASGVAQSPGVRRLGLGAASLPSSPPIISPSNACQLSYPSPYLPFRPERPRNDAPATPRQTWPGPGRTVAARTPRPDT